MPHSGKRPILLARFFRTVCILIIRMRCRLLVESLTARLRGNLGAESLVITMQIDFGLLKLVIYASYFALVTRPPSRLRSRRCLPKFCLALSRFSIYRHSLLFRSFLYFPLLALAVKTQSVMHRCQIRLLRVRLNASLARMPVTCPVPPLPSPVTLFPCDTSDMVDANFFRDVGANFGPH